ncbi:hypothetical protein HGRIS_007962 [Hohenbuehelia grisea]|uniref:Cupin type-2 domain-containing protein n=1 Tax=Hohenbuehelia grisea TaxID=104357 RepID=A0ABR3J6G8_9AGAR
MAAPASHSLPGLRRIVTAHDEEGLSIVESNAVLPTEKMELVPGARGCGIWVTTDSIPTNDTNLREDGAKRNLDPEHNFGLVHPEGTNLRCTDLAPGGITPMHRTSSLDYNILVQGEIVLITEDGVETHLKNPGDTVVQKGTMHAWRNPGKTWARWISVLMAATPATVDGVELQPELKPYGPSGPHTH